MTLYLFFSRWPPAATLDLVSVMLDHPRNAIAGLSLFLKFGFDPMEILRFLYILPFWLEITYSRPFLESFGGIFSPNMVTHLSIPQNTILARKHVV